MKIFFSLAFICFFARNLPAQNKYVDSLTASLSKTDKPIDRFNEINKILENDVRSGGNIDSSFCTEMLQLSEKLHSDSLLAISYNMIANFFAKKGDYPTALEYLFKAIPLAEKSADKRRISSLYFDIALIYTNLQNPQQAFVYNQKGGENLPDKSSPMYDYMTGQFYRNMARYYLSINKPDSALPYVQYLEQESRRLKAPIIELPALFLSGAVYAQLKENDMAEIYFRKANMLSDSVNSVGIKMTNDKYYIPYLLDNNRIEEAHQLASKLFQLGKKIDNDDMKLIGAGFLRIIFEKTHQIDSAYFYSVLESAIKDSIFSQNNINKMQALSFKEQLRVIEEENKRTVEETRRKQNIQYEIIAFGIVVFVILFLLLSHSVVADERWISFLAVLGLLILFEFINLIVEPSLSSITNASPVLMLIGLVAIAALLIPLHHRTEKWIKESMIEKNKAIRLAAAKKTIEKLEHRKKD